MKQSIYLHRPIVDILNCYGKLEDVVNRILEEAAAGKFDVMDKPACPDRVGAGRYDIEILEPNYLELLTVYSPFSPKISIRRLIYWFVEQEMYDELEWEPCKEYQDRNVKLLNTKLSNGLSELEKATRYANHSTKTKLSQICASIREIQEYLKK